MNDWFRILTEIQRCGISLRAAAKRSKVGYWAIYGAWRGGGHKRTAADLRHAEGERLLELWCEVVQRDRTEAPKLR